MLHWSMELATVEKNSERGQNGQRHRKKEKKARHKQVRKREGQVPDWFLENCVKTASELSASKIHLTILNRATCDQSTNQKITPSATRDYEVMSAVYELLQDIFIGPSDKRKIKRKGNNNFLYDAVHLRFPDKGQIRGGTEFLATVVEHFAQSIGADLIWLGAEDIVDLIDHVTASTGHHGCSDQNDEDAQVRFQ